MDGTGVQVGERVNKTGRQILVEKQPGWLLRQPDYSRPGAHARQRTLGRRGCRRASAVESRRGSRPPAFRTPGRTGHLRSPHARLTESNLWIDNNPALVVHAVD